MTIKTKLLFSFLTTGLMPILLVGFFGIYQSKQSVESAQLSNLETIAELKVDKIETFFIERTADIKEVQHHLENRKELHILSRLIQDQNHPAYIAAKKNMDEALGILSRESGYIDVMLVNPEGKIVYVSNPLHRDLDLGKPLPDPDNRAFEEGSKDIYFSDVFMNDVEGIPYGMLITAPVSDLQGQFIGVVALEVDMDSLYRFIQDTTGLGLSGETLIGTKVNGAALFLNPLRHDKKAALEKRVAIGSEIAFPIQEAVEGRAGSGLSIDYRGVEIIAAWRYIPSLKWGLVTKIDAKESFLLVSSLTKQFLLFIGILLLPAAWLGLAFSASIAKPIIALQKGMEGVGNGDLACKVATDAQDEIGALSRAFEKMTGNLADISASRNALTQGIQESMEALQQEIVERKKAEKNQRQAATVFNACTEAITITDAKGRILSVNPAFTRVTGYAPEEVIGKNPNMLQSGRHNKDFYKKMWNAIYTSGHWQGEIWNRKKDGEIYPEMLSITGVKNKKGKVFQYIALFSDMSKEKLAAAEMKHLNVELKSANTKLNDEMAERERIETELRLAQKLEAVGQLAAGIAHEINSPIQFVGDNLHFLKTSFEDYLSLIQTYREVCGTLSKIPGQEKLIEQIREAEEEADLPYLEDHLPQSFNRTFEGIERVTDIVKAMKDFSHPDQKQKALTDLNKGIASTLTVAKNEYKYVADIETAFGNIPQVKCHAGEINQVFLNLIVNAAHAIGDVVKDSGKKGIIRIQTQMEKEDTVLITVRDSGGGIPAKIRQRVFDPFFTTKAVGQGTGQGLAISRSAIVDKHGGSLTLESEEGKGTTFSIRLPIDEKDEKDEKQGKNSK